MFFHVESCCSSVLGGLLEPLDMEGGDTGVDKRPDFNFLPNLWRRLCAISSRAHFIAGYSLSMNSKFFLERENVSQMVSARTVATRRSCANRQISPKCAPSDSCVLMSLSFLSIETTPDSMKYILDPMSPSCMMYSPFKNTSNFNFVRMVVIN